MNLSDINIIYITTVVFSGDFDIYNSLGGGGNRLNVRK